VEVKYYLKSAYYNKETIMGMLSTGILVGIHRQPIARDMYNQMPHNMNGSIYCQHSRLQHYCGGGWHPITPAITSQPPHPFCPKTLSISNNGAPVLPPADN
jgi:hypothetical protein